LYNEYEVMKRLPTDELPQDTGVISTKSVSRPGGGNLGGTIPLSGIPRPIFRSFYFRKIYFL